MCGACQGRGYYVVGVTLWAWFRAGNPSPFPTEEPKDWKRDPGEERSPATLQKQTEGGAGEIRSA